MSVMVTGNFPKGLQIGAQAITFWGEYNEKDTYYSKIFKSMTSQEAYMEDTLVSGLGIMPAKNESNPVSYDSMSQGYTTRYTIQTYGLGFQISYEQRKFGKEMQIMEKGMNHLARSLKETKEIVAANKFNNGFDSTYTGGDGIELLATNHPTRAGTFSNELATPADFSEAALEDIFIQIYNATNDRGLRIGLKPKSLLIPSALKFEAQRVVYSDLQSGTANNDLNATKEMNLLPQGIICNPYLTSDTAWFVLTDAPEGFKNVSAVDGEFSNDGSFDTADHKYKLMSLFAMGWTDPRAAYGSAGV
jgi:hypothetical protein